MLGARCDLANWMCFACLLIGFRSSTPLKVFLRALREKQRTCRTTAVCDDPVLYPVRSFDSTVTQEKDLYNLVVRADFDTWLHSRGKSLGGFLTAAPLDAVAVNAALVAYGRELYDAGRPYWLYSETVNGVASKAPSLRRQLRQAWDLAFLGWRSIASCAASNFHL